MNQRMTKQRKAILSYLQKVQSHPTAEKIHSEVCKELPDISLGTVYRNLQTLIDNRQIIRLELDGEFHFDACMQSHQHYICKECKNIIDGFDKSIEKKIIQNINPEEFTPETAAIYIIGTCKKCKNKTLKKN